MRFSYYIFLLYLLNTTSLRAQGYEATASLDKPGMFIGDQAQLSIRISGWADAQIAYIAWDSLAKKNIECLEVFPAKLLSQNERIVAANITTFETGELTIPPMTVVLKTNSLLLDTVYTNPLKLLVYEVAPDSTGLAPIKDIIVEEKDISDYYLHIGLFVLVLLVLLAIGIFYFQNQKNRNKKAIVYDKNQTPQAKALRKLTNLEAQNYPKQGKEKLFCSELTFILREYLAAEYGFPALEMTTSELLLFCKNNNILQEQNVDLQQVMNISDFVKFAEGDAENIFFTKAINDVRVMIKV